MQDVVLNSTVMPVSADQALKRRHGTRRGARPPAPQRNGRFRLARVLLDVIDREPSVIEVIERAEAFEWLDGLDGADCHHTPLALVRRKEGDLAFVDAMPRARLRRDPELGGIRRRIELECLARGASYEIWTEDEIEEDKSVVQVLRVADAHERISYSAAMRAKVQVGLPPPSIVLAMARRMLLDELRPVGNGWIGRSSLTGIPMSLLRDMDTVPGFLGTVWRPTPLGMTDSGVPRAGSSAAGAPGEKR